MVQVEALMKYGSTFALVLEIILLAGLPGCISIGGDSDTKTSKNAAEVSINREVTEMVKLYRTCLQKHEDNPAKARENCGIYRDAIRDLAPDKMRTINGETQDRVHDKTSR
jgi:hypothetical protein